MVMVTGRRGMKEPEDGEDDQRRRQETRQQRYPGTQTEGFHEDGLNPIHLTFLSFRHTLGAHNTGAALHRQR